MSLAGVYTDTSTIFLQPRPLARYPGSFVLLPLLPRPRTVKPLPAEVWSKVLSYVIDEEDGRIGIPVPERRARWRERWRLLLVCKPWVVSVYYGGGWSTKSRLPQRNADTPAFDYLCTNLPVILGNRSSSTLLECAHLHRKRA
jgi:hypothetical protein